MLQLANWLRRDLIVIALLWWIEALMMANEFGHAVQTLLYST